MSANDKGAVSSMKRKQTEQRHPVSWLSYSKVSTAVAAYSGADECIEFIRQSFTQCVQQHDCPASELSILPKRTIRLGKNENDIQLHESVDEKADYIALSYCWGNVSDGKPLTTTLSSISSMKERLEWNVLPALFKDVITIARKLGVQYIWIDSLCIIQDSKEDWEIESSKMASYYGNAYITLAADMTTNPYQTILVARDEYLLSQRFEVEDGRGGLTFIEVRNHDYSFRTNFSRITKLHDRAWVFQESVLSPRIIHYTSGALFWECQKGVKSESSLALEDDPNPANSLFWRLSQCASKPYFYWQQLVEQYACRSLTFSSDKLPALSGVATKIYAIRESQYLAGLWKDNILLDLMWRMAVAPGTVGRNNRDRVPSAYSTYIAPSWSWASITGPVEYFLKAREIDYVVSFDSAECMVAGLNRFGAVKNGSLVLTGPVKEAVWEEEKSHNNWPRAKLKMESDGHSDIYLDPDVSTEPIEFHNERNGLQRTLQRVTTDAKNRAEPTEPLQAPATKAEGSSERLNQFQSTLSLLTGDAEVSAEDSEHLKAAVRTFQGNLIRTLVHCLYMGRDQGDLSDYALVLGRSLAVPGAFVRLGIAREKPRLGVDVDRDWKGWFASAEVWRVTIV